MKAKSSAHYQREYRRRLREQGLVKKEIWIRPEHAKKLAEFEKLLRVTDASPTLPGVHDMTSDHPTWTTMSLFEALPKEALFTDGGASVELIDGVEPSLQIIMHEYGDLPVFATVFGEQIIVESVLCPQSDVNDVQRFNETILRTHKYFPLSTISLDTLADGESYYHMFGSLSATSRMLNIMFEIEILARNVIQATEAYEEFLTVSNDA